MANFGSKIKLLFASKLLVFFCVNTLAQLPTYTIDPDFNTELLFRASMPVQDLYLLEDGRILIGGGYSNDQVSGLAMIFSDGEWDVSFQSYEGVSASEIITQNDGYVYPGIYGYGKVLLDGTPWTFEYGDFWSDYNAGGTNNPYNLQRAWDIYQQENGNLLIAGAIGTDTLQPGILRGLARIHADGMHDPTFPEIDIMPNNPGGAIRKVYKAPDGSWYVSGGFTGLNGHETNHIAKLSPSFEVDTDFVSPFMYDGPVNYAEDIILVDSQSRVWVSGHQMRLQENPNDSIQIIRLMPDGEVDENFIPRKLENNYPDGWIWRPSLAYTAQELETYPGNYIIYGSFSHFEDSAQPCITVVNDAGFVQEHFFQGMGATVNQNLDDGPLRMPRIDCVEQLEDGSLFVGGAFSEFMGQTHYSLVKLNLGFLSTEQETASQSFKIYPNPAQDQFIIQPKENWVVSNINVQIRDTSGRLVLSQTLSEYRIDISKLNPGLYLVQVFDLGEPLGTARLVVE